MRGLDGWRLVGQRACALLAYVALALIVVVPPGFMVDGGGGGPTRIVICTGHGPMAATIDLSGKGAPSRGKRSDTPCVFAGHGASGATAPTAMPAALAWAIYVAPVVRAYSQFAPGRGVSAPPPARAPPISLA